MFENHISNNRRADHETDLLMYPPFRLVDRIDGFVVGNATGADDLLDLVVEDQCLAIKIDNQNSVGNFEVKVLHDDDAHIFLVKSKMH